MAETKAASSGPADEFAAVVSSTTKIYSENRFTVLETTVVETQNGHCGLIWLSANQDRLTDSQQRDAQLLLEQQFKTADTELDTAISTDSLGKTGVAVWT